MPGKFEKQRASNGDDTPMPAEKALLAPHLAAQELQQEIGDSEAWDEASEQDDQNPVEAED